MANWQRHIYLNPEWEQAQEGEISTRELATVVSKRLKALTPFKDEYVEQSRLDLVDEFEAAAEDADLTVDDFDYLMNELYDWGDIRLDGNWNGKKVCWIDTMTRKEVA